VIQKGTQAMSHCTSTLSTCAALAVLASASHAFADVTVVVNATKDATIFATTTGADPGTASGKGPGLFAGSDGNSRPKRSLVTFDVASAAIPANATILGVTMTMQLAQIAGQSDGSNLPQRTFRLFSVRQNWGEGPSGLPTKATLDGTGQGFTRQIGDSSWSFANFDQSPWTAGGDVVPTEIAAVTFAAPYVLSQSFTWSTAGMLSDVRGWVAGTVPNNGWQIRNDAEATATSFLAFWSKDGAAVNGNPALAPQLSITYTTP